MQCLETDRSSINPKHTKQFPSTLGKEPSLYIRSSNSEWSTGKALDTCTAIWCQDNVRYTNGLTDAPVQTPTWYRSQKKPVVKELDNILNWANYLAHGLRQIHLGGLSIEHREEAYNGLILAVIKDLGQVVELKQLRIQEGSDFAALVEQQVRPQHRNSSSIVKYIKSTKKHQHEIFPLYRRVRNAIRTWREYGANKEVLEAIKYGVRPVWGPKGPPPPSQTGRWINIPAVTELTRLETQGIIRKCQESEAYVIHQALMILKSDGLRARLIMNPESINSHVEKKKNSRRGSRTTGTSCQAGGCSYVRRYKERILFVGCGKPAPLAVQRSHRPALVLPGSHKGRVVFSGLAQPPHERSEEGPTDQGDSYNPVYGQSTVTGPHTENHPATLSSESTPLRHSRTGVCRREGILGKTGTQASAPRRSHRLTSQQNQDDRYYRVTN
ncbi:hypothetical protein SARC_07807 [Sphaeroforma arctica JP610]|uniref:Uncharacterized protein n=1 Tax=Sphaeroforma arctica JP610 TaxID=667725 RepID=A0A0L0FV44_9EUKA|nr:hypothetical protein SARC_07807 [Sphaeroforma arctica JP610]KNC79808.1 hypothetical protein SARC_07807 [Sphaeroforma arctica JP610]|eukprot:XP_014153710.1 hypothetical protein SARC_07807 [Sphaeroforma arctica JP610]